MVVILRSFLVTDLPFFYQRPKFVRCEIHAMEVGEEVLALNFIYSELDLTEGRIMTVITLFTIIIQVRQRYLEHTAF